MKNLLKNLCNIILFFAIFCLPVNGYSLCKARFVNPITEVGWVNMFPVKIGGVTIYAANQKDDEDELDNPVCICSDASGTTLGFNISLWQPLRIIDAVFDAGCMPALGVDLKITNPGEKQGGIQHTFSGHENPQYFAQSHFIIAPFLQILGLMTDIKCLQDNGVEGVTDFDIAYLTEVDPTWNDDFMAMVLNPEVILFTNPVTGLACMSDAVATTFKTPIDALYWCMGSWGDVYPLTGTNGMDTIIGGAATTAGRTIFKMIKEMQLLDRAVDVCSAVYTPIWIKSHYKLQPLRPRAMTSGSIVIGQNTDTWAYKTFDPFQEGFGNWSFILWRKIHCCLGYSLDN